MAEIIGSRLAELIELRNTSQSAVARAIGVSQPTIGRLISGETPETGKLLELARELRTSPEYLVGESDDLESRSLQDRQLGFHGAPPERPDIVELNEFDVKYGLGASYIHDVPVTGERRVFSRKWIRQFTDSPMEYLFFATGIGDSMKPTIDDSDIVLIDTFDRTPRFVDKLWAIEIGGMGAIKRLRPTKDGLGMILISSNPEVPDDTAYDGEMQIIGRVVAVVKKT